MWSAKYRAYGNLAALDVSEIDNPLRFQGQYFDAETGLHYNRHRYYNPSNGRFLTPDPIKLVGGLNNYQYVNNPTGWIDPLGLNNCPGVTMHKGVPISNDARGHLERADGYSSKSGVKGAHNRDEFLQAATDNKLHILSETQSPSTPGLSEITYGRDSLDRTGKVDGIKEFGNPKTVYDPSVISTDQMFEAGKEAAASGYSEAKASGKRVYSAYHNGIKFRIYLDETLTTVTNFHPSMK
jgi:RHS repeat-associated protein